MQQGPCNQGLSDCKLTPLGQAGGSALFESVAAIEMALVVEMVVDRGTTRDAFELLVLTAARSRRGAPGDVERDGLGRWRVDDPRRAHEGEAGSPRAALRAGAHDPARHTETQRRHGAGVP